MKQEIIKQILSGRKETLQEEAEAFAPANIALCKYWGKRDITLNLPVTDSLSLSLGRLGSHCRLSFCEQNDILTLNGASLPPDHPFSKRLTGFLDLFRSEVSQGYRVDAVNTIPTAAGFASSASGFASLVLALNRLHGWNLAEKELSMLARLGSGSACRSLWQGFVHWHAGTRADGMDSFAEPLEADWPALCIGLLVLDSGIKPMGSTEAMLHTVKTSALYAAWPDKVTHDLKAIREAIRERQFTQLGETAESNALAMHATMMAAQPPVLYWQPASLQAILAVWAARNAGLNVFFTMDAGPNIKLLFLETDRQAVQTLFPGLIMDPILGSSTAPPLRSPAGKKKGKGARKRRHGRIPGLTILHEDRDILVVNKEPGLLTIATEEVRSRTAYFLLTDYVRKGIEKSKERVFIVHRLDRETSGVLVFARTPEAKRQLQDHWDTAEKQYVAVVHGHLQKTEGEIRSYLTENSALQVYSTPHASKGRPACTAYRVRHTSSACSVLDVQLLTGRKHQIRVHLSELGHPVLGDRKYGKAGDPYKRLALHARSLTISHPHTGERMCFTAPEPPHFSRWLNPRNRVPKHLQTISA